MIKSLRKVILSLMVWYAVVAASITVMYMLVGKTSAGPEGKRYLTFAGILGFFVVLLCWPVCRRFGRVGGVLAGLALGLVAPIVGGWMWGRAADHWGYSWGHSWTALEAQVEGLQLSIPSAIAGAIVGLLQARKEIDRSPRT